MCSSREVCLRTLLQSLLKASDVSPVENTGIVSNDVNTVTTSTAINATTLEATDAAFEDPLPRRLLLMTAY